MSDKKTIVRKYEQTKHLLLTVCPTMHNGAVIGSAWCVRNCPLHSSIDKKLKVVTCFLQVPK